MRFRDGDDLGRPPTRRRWLMGQSRRERPWVARCRLEPTTARTPGCDSARDERASPPQRHSRPLRTSPSAPRMSPAHACSGRQCTRGRLANPDSRKSSEAVVCRSTTEMLATRRKQTRDEPRGCCCSSANRASAERRLRRPARFAVRYHGRLSSSGRRAAQTCRRSSQRVAAAFDGAGVAPVPLAPRRAAVRRVANRNSRS